MLVVSRYGNELRQSVATIENMRDDCSKMYYGRWFMNMLERAGFTYNQAHYLWHTKICELDAKGRVKYARDIVTRKIRPGSQVFV